MSAHWKRRKLLALRSKNTKQKLDLSEDYKSKICENAYLGKKGYTIPKSSIDEKDLNELYSELKVQPMTSGVAYNTSVDEGSFPVYRENANKTIFGRKTRC